MKKVAYCEACDKMQSYHVVEEEQKVTVKGYSFKVKVKNAYCDKCGGPVGPYEVEKEVDRTVFDEYRRLSGLLTSDEIRTIRKKRNMSQVDLARFIKAGEKNIARYETGTIQDPVFDFLMRMVDDDDCYKAMVAFNDSHKFRVLTEREMMTTFGGGNTPIKKKSKKITK